jgi:hypothetical protein
MAGFQVSMHGRFWVSTEGGEPLEARAPPAPLSRFCHALAILFLLSYQRARAGGIFFDAGDRHERFIVENSRAVTQRMGIGGFTCWINDRSTDAAEERSGTGAVWKSN